MRLLCVLIFYPSVLSNLFPRSELFCYAQKEKNEDSSHYSQGRALLAVPSGRTPPSRVFSSVLKNMLKFLLLLLKSPLLRVLNGSGVPRHPFPESRLRASFLHPAFRTPLPPIHYFSPFFFRNSMLSGPRIGQERSQHRQDHSEKQ